MFTGIITDIGTITDIHGTQDKTIFVKSHQFDLNTMALGDSIACSGICLTIVSKENDVMAFDVSQETISKTTLGAWQIGDKINLEQALRMGDHLGGHQVSGHVDSVATLTNMTQIGDSWQLEISPPQEYIKYLAPKGSVVLDGISLTINQTHLDKFYVNIIPHTYTHTIVQFYQVGQKINLEIDTIVRYMAHYLEHFKVSSPKI